MKKHLSRIKDMKCVGCLGGYSTILHLVIKEALSEKMAVEQNPEKDEGAKYMDNGGMGFPGRSSSRCQGPEVESFPVC